MKNLTDLISTEVFDRSDFDWRYLTDLISTGSINDSSDLYWKYLRAAMTRNFSIKSSESRTAMWAARPIRELVLLGSAWCTSYLNKDIELYHLTILGLGRISGSAELW